MRATEKLRVLIAEDGLVDSRAMVAVIEYLGHQVVGTAPDGEKVVEMATSLHPDVVMMDIEMPLLDGIEACRLIQESFPLPVVILTAHDSKEMVQRASAAGAGAYLIKPPDAQATDRAITVSRARFEDLMQLRELNGELQRALAQVDVLRGIIPICMYCKDIRDDKGYWEDVAAYVTRHSAARFSHGICPTCFAKASPAECVPPVN